MRGRLGRVLSGRQDLHRWRDRRASRVVQPPRSSLGSKTVSPRAPPPRIEANSSPKNLLPFGAACPQMPNDRFLSQHQCQEAAKTRGLESPSQPSVRYTWCKAIASPRVEERLRDSRQCKTVRKRTPRTMGNSHQITTYVNPPYRQK